MVRKYDGAHDIDLVQLFRLQDHQSREASREGISHVVVSYSKSTDCGVAVDCKHQSRSCIVCDLVVKQLNLNEVEKVWYDHDKSLHSLLINLVVLERNFVAIGVIKVVKAF